MHRIYTIREYCFHVNTILPLAASPENMSKYRAMWRPKQDMLDLYHRMSSGKVIKMARSLPPSPQKRPKPTATPPVYRLEDWCEDPSKEQAMVQAIFDSLTEVTPENVKVFVYISDYLHLATDMFREIKRRGYLPSNGYPHRKIPQYQELWAPKRKAWNEYLNKSSLTMIQTTKV